MNLSKILDLIISIHFKNHDFNHRGKLEWCPVTERQKKRYFEKRGKEITKQRVRYSIIENFSSSKKSDSSDYRQLLISEIEEDGIFYCIYDYRTMGRMGQTFRYKFKIIDYLNLSDYSKCKYELIDKRIIMIR